MSSYSEHLPTREGMVTNYGEGGYKKGGGGASEVLRLQKGGQKKF